MTRPLSILAGILGLLALAVAALYWLTPAGELPAFFPGYAAGSGAVHVKHAFGAVAVAAALFLVAWFSRERD